MDKEHTCCKVCKEEKEKFGEWLAWGVFIGIAGGAIYIILDILHLLDGLLSWLNWG